MYQVCPNYPYYTSLFAFSIAIPTLLFNLKRLHTTSTLSSCVNVVLEKHPQNNTMPLCNTYIPGVNRFPTCMYQLLQSHTYMQKFPSLSLFPSQHLITSCFSMNYN